MIPLSKAKAKFIRSLQRKKYRQRYDNFVAEGVKIVDEIIASQSPLLKTIVGTETWWEIAPDVQENVECIVAEEKALKEISSLVNTHEVLAILEIPKPKVDDFTIQKGVSLFLDGIQDPGNLGTILRTADWFGIRHVFLGNGTVDAFNAKVIQAGMGAFLRLSYSEISFEALREKFPDTTIFGADMNGDNIFNIPLEERKGIVVIGNEGKGISETVKKGIDRFIHIPKSPHGGAESLNAGVAAGIICAAFGR